jgi:molybdopterin synthase catalytic subunit
MNERSRLRERPFVHGAKDDCLGSDSSMVQLTRDVIDHTALTEAVRRPGSGAVVTFLGTVRDLTGDEVTVALDYEGYEPMAEAKMAEIEADTRARWPVGDVAFVHRLGRLEVGDVSVAVAVSAAHRGPAFDACRFAIDRLKELVPIWKRENWADGRTEWVHPTRNSEVRTRNEQPS